MSARALKTERVQYRAERPRISVSVTQIEALDWNYWAKKEGYRNVREWLVSIATFEMERLRTNEHVARVKARGLTTW